MSVRERLLLAFRGITFTFKDAYNACDDSAKESVRARIYENLGKDFRRIGRGVYVTIDSTCVLVEGDGRTLDFLEDESVDCIITDHPWKDYDANCGGNRNFSAYDCFEYDEKDFREKARVLKDGCFLCELIPAENASNFECLFRLKKTAESSGFLYYAKVPWIKGTFVSNTGRKSKNSEDIMIFSKGPARALRPDRQRGLNSGGNPVKFISGTAKMLPADFNVQAVPANLKVCPSQKPFQLFEQLLEYVTRPGEIVLDQFAGSGSVGIACQRTGRLAILIEKAKEQIEWIKKRLNFIDV
jgi:DNA modification methylase